MYTLEEIIRFLEFYDKQGLTIAQVLELLHYDPNSAIPSNNHVSH
jgi:hypothetical protein